MDIAHRSWVSLSQLVPPFYNRIYYFTTAPSLTVQSYLISFIKEYILKVQLFEKFEYIEIIRTIRVRKKCNNKPKLLSHQRICCNCYTYTFGNRTSCAIEWYHFSPESQIGIVKDLKFVISSLSAKKTLASHLNGKTSGGAPTKSLKPNTQNVVPVTASPD